MKRKLLMGVGTVFLSALSLMADGRTAQAGVIATHFYDLFDHPDGSEAPPIYGLRLDGIEHYLTGQGGSSDSWTFSFTDVTAKVTIHDDAAQNTLHIAGTGFGGRDAGGGSWLASGAVNFDFTYTGFAAGAGFDPLDPNITIFGSGPGASSKGLGSFTFEDSVLSIGAGSSLGLIAWGNASGVLFNFKANDHRLNCPNDDGCGYPVGWGWLGLTGNSSSPFHTSFDDFLFTTRYVVPAPATALLLMTGLAGLALRRRRSA